MKSTPQATSGDPFKARITATMVACLLLCGAVLSRAVLIQIVGDPRLEKMAKRQFQSKVLMRPRRGSIVDRNGEALAVNVETSSLAANPSKIKNKRTVARLISKATDMGYEKLLDRLQEKREFIWIKRHLSENEMNGLKKLQIIGSDGDLMDGLWLVKESKRAYPHNELAAHILGSVNVDSDGLDGVELWFNESLRGKLVTVNATKDALGRPTFIDTVAAKEVKDGEAVSLTLDASLQFGVEQELKFAVQKHNARSGQVIVMNAVTGEILAMANEPSFNPSHRNVPAAHRRNRVVTDGFEPGSTLKAVLLAGALAHGSKLTDQLWGHHGSFTVQGKRISEAETHEKFEWTSLKKMIQVSSNVVAAKLALKLGADHYYKTLQSFGFGSKTDVGFPGEISGKIPARKAWQPLTLANIGFGQGILATPMQMTRAYAAFINGGWLVQPTLLKNPPAGFKPAVPKRILTQAVSDGVMTALRSVTEEGGTGSKAILDGYTVAGKTGTAQTVDSATGRYSRSHYISTFIGFPVSVDQKFVIFTMIDGPRGIYYASETAAPLFKNVLQLVANRFSLPSKPELNVTPKALAGNATKDRIQVSAAHFSPPEVAPVPAASPTPLRWEGTSADGALIWRMPALTGLTPREAIRALQGHRFQVELQGPGTGIVHAQHPETGKTVADGSTVRLTLSDSVGAR